MFWLWCRSLQSHIEMNVWKLSNSLWEKKNHHLLRVNRNWAFLLVPLTRQKLVESANKNLHKPSLMSWKCHSKMSVCNRSEKSLFYITEHVLCYMIRTHFKPKSRELLFLICIIHTRGYKTTKGLWESCYLFSLSLFLPCMKVKEH